MMAQMLPCAQTRLHAGSSAGLQGCGGGKRSHLRPKTHFGPSKQASGAGCLKQRSTPAWGRRNTQTTATAQLIAEQDKSVLEHAVPSIEGTFNWAKNWYPIAALDYLHTDRPNNVHLLGLSLVVWTDGKGTWHCLQDRCSHRLAPLSEGRIEDGNIMCCYHGWRFNGQGSCVKVPQIDDAKAHAFACSQPNSRVKAYPTQVAHDLLWVWPESGLDALQESAAAPLKLQPPADEDGQWQMAYPWFSRDLPLRFDTVVENLTDISHAPHAHHGVPGMGNRNKPHNMSYVRDSFIERDAGYVVGLQNKDVDMDLKVSFTPPVFIRHKAPFLTSEIMVVPTQPGWVRVYLGNLFPNNKKALPAPVRVLNSIKAAHPALDHALLKHAIFDGDTYLLHAAERLLLKDNNEWRKNFFMPANADLPIVTFRRWLDQFGGNVPTLGPLEEMPPALSKQQTLDRYQQHTANCTHCRKALCSLQIWTTAFWAGAALAAATVLIRAFYGHPLLQPPMLLGAAAAAALAAWARFLEGFKSQYLYRDYVHAHRE